MPLGKKLTKKLKKNLPVTGPQAPTVYELMQWYCLTTNTHGCRRIVVSNGRLRRYIWILLTLTAVSLIFWQCSLLIMSYYSVSISITVTFQKLVFPAVTICNLNPYKYSKIRPHLASLEEETTLYLQDLFDFDGSNVRRRRSARTQPATDFLQSIPLVKLEPTEKGNLMAYEIGTGKVRSVDPRTVRTRTQTVVRSSNPTEETIGFRLCDQYNKSDCMIYTFSSGVFAIQDWYRLHYMNYLANMSMEEKIQMGYSAEEFIVMCKYDGISCDYRNFTLFHHPLYGNCYTFNGGQDDVLMSSMGGQSYGLQVVLYIDDEEYNPFLVTSTGAKILIHHQDEYPFIEEIGTEIQPAAETNIGMQLTESSKLSSPYSDCTMDGSNIPVTNLFNKSYSLNICLHSCFQRAMVATCGCAHYNQPLPDGSQYCDQETNPNWVFCFFKLHEKFLQEELGCRQICREACSSKQWSLTGSIANWPAANAEEWMLRVLSWEMGDIIKRNLTRNDLVSFGVFYSDLNFRSLSENPSNSIVTLLSNMGGQLGLWLSCSMVCVIEIVEVFIIDCSWVFIRQHWGKLKKKWAQKKESQVQQPARSQERKSYNNSVSLGDEDPPTFNTALQLPVPRPDQVPRTPPPNYNTLRIQHAFVQGQEHSEDDIESF
ncbi:epithelial sodium channel subunit gamma isoform X2 [Microcaecilia unicolor]|nr:amiloride-sensitive sodium channel subunit gamma isoform X2 [Microcaecilia unicolor]